MKNEYISNEMIPMGDRAVIARVRFLDCTLVATIRGDIGGDGVSDYLIFHPTKVVAATLIDSDGAIVHVESELESELMDLFDGRVICGSLESPELRSINVTCASGRYEFVEMERY